MLRFLYLLAALTIAVTILISNARDAEKVQDFQAYQEQDLLKGSDPVK